MSNESKNSKAKLQSLKCPWCGCRQMYTIETRSTPQRIIRTRKCSTCGRRMKTHEQFSGHAAFFKKTTTDTVSATNGSASMPQL